MRTLPVLPNASHVVSWFYRSVYNRHPSTQLCFNTMGPPIKPTDDRFLGYVEELNCHIDAQDIDNETWISKSIESAIKDLPLIDLTLFSSFQCAEELVKFIRKERKIVDAIESLACKMVSVAQNKKFRSVKNPSLARRLLNEGKKLEIGQRYNAAISKLNEVIISVVLVAH